MSINSSFYKDLHDMEDQLNEGDNSREEMPEPEKVYQLKVEGFEHLYRQAFKVMEVGTDEDYDGDSEGFRYCGAIRGIGSTIQSALEDFLEQINETVEQDIKYRWA